MTQRRSQRGVTLIELVIAVSLLSVLSLGMLYAIRIGLNAMEKTNRRLLANRRATGTQRILDQQIGGFMAVAMLCRGQEGQPGPPMMFFAGDATTLRFVSSYSLNEGMRGHPKVLEFAVIPGDLGKGVRLVVNEFPYTGPRALGQSCLGMTVDPESHTPLPQFPPVQVGPGSFVLADQLAYCRISYHITFPPNAPEPDAWLPRWNQVRYPDAIRIDMAPLEPERAVIPMLPIVIPIRVTRDPLIPYWD